MVKPKPKLKRKGLIPPSILAVLVIVLVALTWIAIASAHVIKNRDMANSKSFINSQCATIGTWNANDKDAAQNALQLSQNQEATLRTDTNLSSSSAGNTTETASENTKKEIGGSAETDTCMSTSKANNNLSTESSLKEDSAEDCSKESLAITSTVSKTTTGQKILNCGSGISDTAKELPTSPAPTAKEDTSNKVDPNGCEAKGQWYRADNNECIPKPAPVAATQAAPAGGGSGSCQAEIAKYDWGHSTATAVMLAESGGDTGTVNNNPATGDYSIGCFQINIYGANARSRPSEAALKNAATNVEFAYRIYKGNGSSFIGQWGVCRSKVSCY